MADTQLEYTDIIGFDGPFTHQATKEFKTIREAIQEICNNCKKFDYSGDNSFLECFGDMQSIADYENISMPLLKSLKEVSKYDRPRFGLTTAVFDKDEIVRDEGKLSEGNAFFYVTASGTDRIYVVETNIGYEAAYQVQTDKTINKSSDIKAFKDSGWDCRCIEATRVFPDVSMPNVVERPLSKELQEKIEMAEKQTKADFEAFKGDILHKPGEFSKAIITTLEGKDKINVMDQHTKDSFKEPILTKKGPMYEKSIIPKIVFDINYNGEPCKVLLTSNSELRSASNDNNMVYSISEKPGFEAQVKREANINDSDKYTVSFQLSEEALKSLDGMIENGKISFWEFGGDKESNPYGYPELSKFSSVTQLSPSEYKEVVEKMKKGEYAPPKPKSNLSLNEVREGTGDISDRQVASLLDKLQEKDKDLNKGK